MITKFWKSGHNVSQPNFYFCSVCTIQLFRKLLNLNISSTQDEKEIRVEGLLLDLKSFLREK